ncbi:antitoxin MazE family protein [Endozoicomonas sp. SCSIO W0465]|uniref:antitoxin MazE family protein n=1 Tax=Endozoicomonas sp. SCSIO W0465 TaxID=2918516 RepID=UPI00207530A4|nr:antitoxin MazE family protein [Endozoicomonas sp. SCSIO W0465]USE37211.1 antitoxin MazE family protein [Endozoicomonas sp. SCSIO W0465]
MSTNASQPKTTRERVESHREALRQAGLRPLQIWVPDTRVKGFDLECQRQSAMLKSDKLERDTMDWIEQTSDDEGWA